MDDQLTLETATRIIDESISAYQSMGHPHVIAELVRSVGEPKVGAPLPVNLRKMEPKACFQNASNLIMNGADYRYAEGLAISSNLGYPIHHAWLVDRDNRVIDPTWGNPESCFYFGVEMEPDELMDRIDSTEHYGVLCPHGYIDTDWIEDFFGWKVKPVDSNNKNPFRM